MNSICMFSNSCSDFNMVLIRVHQIQDYRVRIHLLLAKYLLAKYSVLECHHVVVLYNSSSCGHVIKTMLSKSYCLGFFFFFCSVMEKRLELINEKLIVHWWHSNAPVVLNRLFNSRSFKLKCLLQIFVLVWTGLEVFILEMKTAISCSSCIPLHYFQCLSKSSFDASQIDILTLMNDFSFFGVHWCD